MATEIKLVVPERFKCATQSQPKEMMSAIEWIVDMNVTLSSSASKSKTIQRVRNVVIVLVAAVIAIALVYLKMEMRELQVQVNNANANLVLLMIKYEKLSGCLHRPHHKTSSDGIDNRIPAVDLRNNDVSLGLDNDYYSGNEAMPSAMLRKLTKYMGAFEDRVRSKRAILTFENKRNFTREAVQVQGNSQVAAATESYLDSNGSAREARGGRNKRDERRGKPRKKSKWRPKRSHRRSSPLVATFVGAVPEQHVTDTVYIGPWVKSTKNDSRYSLNKFHLVEDRKAIEVTVAGLYMISAQIFYFGQPKHYSYWILLRSEGSSSTQKLIKCATGSSSTATETSCHTSLIVPLKRGDRLHFQQQERDRLINLREGHSYVQLVLLSSDQINNRRTS